MGLENLVSVLPDKYIIKVVEQKPNLVDWSFISTKSQLSEEFIEKYKDKVNWYNILEFQKNLSPEFRKKWEKWKNKR